MSKCPDCGGELENGVMLDTTYGGTLVQRYARSDNVPSRAKNYVIGSNEANFKDLRRVIAYRCTKCNRIFQYAQEIVTLKDLNKRVRNVFIIILLLFAVIFAVAIIGFGS